jgi:hypothetical protein
MKTFSFGSFGRLLVDTEESPKLNTQDHEDLPFSNHLYCLNSGHQHTRGLCCSRALHRAQPSFDMAVIGFDATNSSTVVRCRQP